MLKVSLSLVSRSDMKTLMKLLMKALSVMKPSLCESKMLKSRSLMMPGN